MLPDGFFLRFFRLGTRLGGQGPGVGLKAGTGNEEMETLVRAELV